MQTRVIYRLQSVTTGRGIYANEENPTLAMLHSLPSTPPPDEDEGIDYVWSNMTYSEREKWFFGFSDLKQLAVWIPSTVCLQILDELGFKLFKYVVDMNYAVCSDFQAIFHKDRVEHHEEIADWVNKIEIAEEFKNDKLIEAIEDTIASIDHWSPEYHTYSDYAPYVAGFTREHKPNNSKIKELLQQGIAA